MSRRQVSMLSAGTFLRPIYPAIPHIFEITQSRIERAFRRQGRLASAFFPRFVARRREECLRLAGPKRHRCQSGHDRRASFSLKSENGRPLSEEIVRKAQPFFHSVLAFGM